MHGHTRDMNASSSSDAVWNSLHEDMQRLFGCGQRGGDSHANDCAVPAPRIWISGREGAYAMSRHQFEQWRQGFTTARR